MNTLLKVTKKDEGERAVLKIEGRLADSWVDELARVAAAAEKGGRQLIFDLEGLSFVDVRGLALLRGAAQRGARLTGASPFVAALIDQERRA
jgi:anti-anti-sigma regulatory factor